MNPIEVSRAFVKEHEARFDDALAIARNEFAALDAEACTETAIFLRNRSSTR